MANNRLYIVDENSKTVFMIAKSFGSGWQAWCKGNEKGLYHALQDFFDHSDEMGTIGTLTELVIKTEYEIDESNYNIIRLDDH